MGYDYNSDCDIQTCPDQCCNYYGTCPNNSSPDTYANHCWHPYNHYEGQQCQETENCCYTQQKGHYSCEKNGKNTARIIGAVISGVVGLVFLIVIGVCLWRRCRQPQGIAPVQNRANFEKSENQFNYGTPVHGQPFQYPPPYPPYGQTNQDQTSNQPYISTLDTYPKK